MGRDPITTRFHHLVTAMNVVGTLSVTGLLGQPLEAQRQGAPLVDALVSGVSAWIWPAELWASSIWASRRLLRSGRLDLAALAALLPMLSLLGIKLPRLI